MLLTYSEKLSDKIDFIFGSYVCKNMRSLFESPNWMSIIDFW